MNIDVKDYTGTSVIDAQTSLNCTLRRDPEEAKKIAEMVLAELNKDSGNKSRKAMLETIIRKAGRQIKKQKGIA